MLEAELFGYERDAFTDAWQSKPGLFQVAHGGTLLLAEIRVDCKPSCSPCSTKRTVPLVAVVLSRQAPSAGAAELVAEVGRHRGH